MTGPRPPSYDVVIVGARCAGAATALLLARAGARVLVVDHGQPGTDTVSTHALMRPAVLQLHRWGLLDAIRASGAPPVRSTRFVYGDEVIDVELREGGGGDALYAPRRTVLDLALVRAAAEAGVGFRFGTGFAGVLRGTSGHAAGVRLRGPGGEQSVKAGFVIGADGRRSAVARAVDADVLRRGRHATSVAYGYFRGLPEGGYRWHYAPGAAGGIIPTNDGEACVFVALPHDAFEADLRGSGERGFRATIAARLPVMADDMAGAQLCGRLLAFAGERGFVRRSQGPGWALVGDAGYFKDPITAHGITDALRDAEILARSVVDGRPEAYPPLRDSLTGTFFRLTDEIASFDWTLEELKARHIALNKAMKLGQGWIEETLSGLPRAA